MTQHIPCQPLSLLEQAAAKVRSEEIPYSPEVLPLELIGKLKKKSIFRWALSILFSLLLGLLRSAKFCIDCERPLFKTRLESSVSSSCLCPLSGIKVPFRQYACNYRSCAFNPDYYLKLFS
jgi:hypothetical protein